MANSRDQRKRLINLHTGTLDSKPSGILNLGEIGVEHSSVKDAKLYVETNSASTSPTSLAVFITEDKTKDLIASAHTDVTKIIEDLTNIVLTGGSGDNIITVSTKDPDSGSNTFTVTHKSGNTMSQSGFKKLSTDAYGHVTGGTAVDIGDVSGLTGFQKAVRDVETKLSVNSGDGDFVTSITVDDHTITYNKGNQASVSVTADSNNGAFITGITTGGTRGHSLTLATGNLERTTGGTANGNKVTDVTVNGKTITVTYGNEATLSVSTTGTGNAVTDVTVNGHAITLKKEKTFSEDGHKHDGGDITGGTVGISYLPTATTVSSDNTTVPTSKAVQDAIDEANLYSVRYKGTTDNVPSGSAKVGDEYIAASAFTISATRSGDGTAKSVEVGDYIIARTSGTTSKWDVKEKNLDGAVTSIGMTDGQVVIATGARTIKSQALSSIKVASATTSDSATTAVSAQTSLSAVSAVSAQTSVNAESAVSATTSLSASTAAALDSAPSLSSAGTTQIKVTAGGKDSNAFTVPFATSATTAVSAQTSVNAVSAVSATTSNSAVTLTTAPSLSSAGTTQIKVTVGGRDSSAFTVPFATSATTAVSAQTSVNAVSASTAAALDSAPSLSSAGTTQIKVTAGGKDSNAFTVPFATSATTAVSAQTSNSATTLTGSYLVSIAQTAATATNNYTTNTQITDKSGNVTTIVGLSDYTIIDCGTY